MPLASHGENCGKGRAEGLYDLAYQRPQPPQKGHDRIKIEQESIIHTYTAHYPCCEHPLLCTYSTQSTLTYPTLCLRGPKALQAPPKPPTISSSPHSGLECENLTRVRRKRYRTVPSVCGKKKTEHRTGETPSSNDTMAASALLQRLMQFDDGNTNPMIGTIIARQKPYVLVEENGEIEVWSDGRTNDIARLRDMVDPKYANLAPESDLTDLTKIAIGGVKEFGSHIESVRWTKPYTQKGLKICLIKLTGEERAKRITKGRLKDLAVKHLKLDKDNAMDNIEDFMEKKVPRSNQQSVVTPQADPAHDSGGSFSNTSSSVGRTSSGELGGTYKPTSDIAPLGSPFSPTASPYSGADASDNHGVSEETPISNAPPTPTSAAQGAADNATVIVVQGDYSMLDYRTKIEVVKNSGVAGRPLDDCGELAPKKHLDDVTKLADKGKDEFIRQLEGVRWTELYSGKRRVVLLKLEGQQQEKRCMKSALGNAVAKPFGLKTEELREIHELLRSMIAPSSQQHQRTITSVGSTAHCGDDAPSNNPADGNVNMSGVPPSPTSVTHSANKPIVIVAAKSNKLVDFGNTVKVVKSSDYNDHEPLDKSGELCPEADLKKVTSFAEKGEVDFKRKLERVRWTEAYRKTLKIGLLKLEGEEREKRCTKGKLKDLAIKHLGLEKAEAMDKIEGFLSEMAATPSQQQQQQQPSIVRLTDKDSLPLVEVNQQSSALQDTTSKRMILAKHLPFNTKVVKDQTPCLIQENNTYSCKTWKEIQDLKSEGALFDDVDENLGFHPELDKNWLSQFKSQKLPKEHYCVPFVIIRSPPKPKSIRSFQSSVFVNILDPEKKRDLRKHRKVWESANKRVWPGGLDAPIRCSPTCLIEVAEGAKGSIELGQQKTEEGREYLARKKTPSDTVRDPSPRVKYEPREDELAEVRGDLATIKQILEKVLYFLKTAHLERNYL
jgi:hypothetical protein